MDYVLTVGSAATVKYFSSFCASAAKHVRAGFWPQFCGAAGVFCIGEVDDANVEYVGCVSLWHLLTWGSSIVAGYQGPQALDSTLNYPMYGALVQAFTIPGQQNMSAVTDMIAEQRAKNLVRMTPAVF